MRLPSLLVLLAACSHAPPTPSSATIEVAVTVDDLPLHGPLLPGQTRVDLARAMLAVLAKHHLPPVVGFVNGVRVEAFPDTRQVLELWRAAGQPLGNHGWSHRNLDETPLDAYLADLTANEPLLEQLEPDPAARHLYRFPFLHEGADPAKRRAVRAFLNQHGYRTAEVSLDGDGWAFSEPRVRCTAKQDQAALRRLHEQFVEVHVDELRRMRALGRQLVQRELRHVLLLHLGVAEVDALDDLLSAYEREGVTWVTLPRALDDPFYAIDPDQGFRGGAAFPYLVAKARGVEARPIYLRGLEEQLDQVCR
jgi:peptidoglycan/xylan/chitin deacetylase (PgdA/CDA1 family)